MLTGDRGLVGRWLRRRLRASGVRVIGFDVLDGSDVTDLAAVRRAASQATVTVHCAVVPLGWSESHAEMMRVNAEGTETVLRAAEEAGHSRVIAFSSAQVFGVFDGERAPEAFPIRDSSPRLAEGAYGASKVAMEDRCEAFTARTGIPTVCPRPVHIWVPGQAADVRRRWLRNPRNEFGPHWNFGAFVDIRDVVDATLRALTVRIGGHSRMILCAPDAAASTSSLEMVERFFPAVPLERGWPPSAHASPALFDSGTARDVLGWQARHTWAELSRESWAARAYRRLREPFPP